MNVIPVFLPGNLCRIRDAAASRWALVWTWKKFTFQVLSWVCYSCNLGRSLEQRGWIHPWGARCPRYHSSWHCSKAQSLKRTKEDHNFTENSFTCWGIRGQKAESCFAKAVHSGEALQVKDGSRPSPAAEAQERSGAFFNQYPSVCHAT